MALYIRIKEGLPFEHPIFEDNFKQAFPKVDLNNLPPEFALFERKQMPVLGAYEVFEGTTYELVDGVYTDVFNIRLMTDVEKAEKQDAVRSAWANIGYPSWLFNEDTCTWGAPIAYPSDASEEKLYTWDESTLSWIEVTE